MVGWADDTLRALLKDAFAVEIVEAEEEPDLVFAVIEPRDPFRIVAAAQKAGRHRTPIVAILPIADARLARRALVAGAQFCWPLDGSLQILQAALLNLVPTGPEEYQKAAKEPRCCP